MEAIPFYPGAYANRSRCARRNEAYDQLKANIASKHLPTAEHSIRVRICATSLGIACGLTSSELTTLAIAAEVHDIGKLNVPVPILNKPEKLTESEWAVIKQHPVWGAGIARVAFPDNPDIARCVMLHHERLDGSGYPNKLSDRDIPALARIIAVADAYIGMTEDRPYRDATDDLNAIELLMAEKHKYDEFVLKTLTRIVNFS